MRCFVSQNALRKTASTFYLQYLLCPTEKYVCTVKGQIGKYFALLFVNKVGHYTDFTIPIRYKEILCWLCNYESVCYVKYELLYLFGNQLAILF